MIIRGLTPILNVSNIQQSFEWFAKLGWKKLWDWGDPPSFGCVENNRYEIFLCENCQGSRGGPMPRHVGDDDTGGVWMSWWVESPEEVDRVHTTAVKEGMNIVNPPADKPWNCREFHLRHPDGHTFRVGAGFPEDEEEEE